MRFEQATGQDVRRFVDHLRAQAASARGNGLSAVATAAALARGFEELLVGCFAGAVRAHPEAPGMALVAVGGLGRGEMAPFSDVDVALVTLKPSHAAVRAIADSFLYPLWDARLQLGHAVRSPREFGELVLSDETVRTTAVDWRPLTGDAAVTAALAEALQKALSSSATRRTIIEQLRTWTARTDTGVVSRLEPNIKTGPGGLREVQKVWWAARLVWRVKKWPDLLAGGYIDAQDFAALMAGREQLLAIRIALHVSCARAQEALRFEFQDDVARTLGMPSADALLATFYRTAKLLRSVCARVLERCLDSHDPPRRREPVRELDGFHVFRGRLTFRTPSQFADGPLDIVRIVRVAQIYDLPLHGHALERMAEAVTRFTDGAWLDPRVGRLFMDILGDPRKTHDALSTLHDLGILERLLPEFRDLTGLAQRDLYHQSTVDAHLIHCAARTMALVSGQADGTPPEIAAVAARIARPHVLVLAALLHDIGKGRGGKHSELGAELARRIIDRWHLARADREDVAHLVLHHLTLFRMSQRRDMQDPELIARLARDLETPERLDMLYVLSYVDAATTGPSAWTAWKGTLLAELYARTRHALAQGAASDSLAGQARERLQLLAELVGGDAALLHHAMRLSPRHLVSHRRALLVRHLAALAEAEREQACCTVADNPEQGGLEVVVVGRDRPGLLADLTAVLAAEGADVDTANIAATQDGAWAIDTFVIRVSGPLANPERRARLASRLHEALLRPVDCSAQIVERRRAQRALQTGAPLPERRVVYDLEASTEATVVDVFAPDRVGLLHDIARALHTAGASIVLARISTEGARAVDAFYVVDAASQRPLNAPQRDHVAAALQDAIAGGSGSPVQPMLS